MQYQQYLFLVPLLPLVTFLVLGLFGRKHLNAASGIIATCSIFVSTLLSLAAAYQYFLGGAGNDEGYRQVLVMKWVWLRFSPELTIDMGLGLDPISAMMIVVVSFVSLMVHVFSLGYMKGEERYTTYFSFLSLFSFSMLALVLATNLFQLYIFWELVGISSFLLIGFYFQRPAAVAAAKKAFIVTRFADLGLLVGILILGYYGKSLDVFTLTSRMTAANDPQFITISTTSFAGISLLTWALTLVFVGGAGKSAMFPLHIWLPDAMEGPTPVSALIHAATMVVAGVYLVARLFPIFSTDPVVLQLVTIVGAGSALLAALMACVQTDIKRVLAYSTMSQIGYMMFSLGIAKNGGEDSLGYTASMFHLFTHAFFKSLLFLCAGIVIHVVHSNYLKDMGGLRKVLPLTHIAFLIGCLAIAGIPPFAGFFSKEQILAAAYRANKLLFATGLVTSGLTAFYMFRLYFSIFWRHAFQQGAIGHDPPRRVSEGPVTTKLPVIILTLCTVVSGLVPFDRLVTATGYPAEGHLDLTFSILPVLVSLVAILLAARLYRAQNALAGKIVASARGFYKVISAKFYVDEMYAFMTRKIVFGGMGRPAAWIDRRIIDGGVRGMAGMVEWVAGQIKGLQSGRIQSYAMCFFAGVGLLVILFVYLV